MLRPAHIQANTTLAFVNAMIARRPPDKYRQSRNDIKRPYDPANLHLRQHQFGTEPANCDANPACRGETSDSH